MCHFIIDTILILNYSVSIILWHRKDDYMKKNIEKPYITDETQLSLLKVSNQGRLKYTLLNDFLSKYSFQKDLFALRGLLAALLHIKTEDITDITILNPIEPGKDITEKECILDIKLELNNTTIINIEIQERYQDFWPERSIIYLCRNFDHLSSGESYNLIKPCIQIGILSKSLFKPDDPRYSDDFYSEYRLLNIRNHKEYSSKFEIRVLSLNQLENASIEDKNDPNGLYRWARIFKASTWEELKMIAGDNPMMNSFVGTVMHLTAEDRVAEACERRRRYSNDIATFEEEIDTAKTKLESLNSELSNLNSELSCRKAEIANKEAEIADKEAEIADKNAILADKDAEIADKDAEISRLKALLDLKEN